MKKKLSVILAMLMAMSLFAGMSFAETPAAGGTMSVVATGDGYGPLFDKFTAETGVKVEVLSMSSGEVLSKLDAEGGTPDADFWFGGGIDAFMSAKEKGYLEQVTFEAAREFAPAYVDAEGYWFSKGMTIVGFLVNNELLAELGLEAPSSWQDLLKPEYAGEIVMSNPAVSGTNYAVVNCLLQTMGEEEGWKYFEALNNNIAYYGRRGADPKNAVIAGEYAIGITYLDLSIDALTADYDVTVIYPSDGIPWVPEGVAVFANSANNAAAKYFVEWLYSNDENLVLLSQLDGKVGIKAVKPSMEGLELAYDLSILMDVDLSLFGAQRSDILARFEPMMGEKVVTE